MSYAGKVAVIPCGQGSFTGEENIDNISYVDLVEAKNIRYDGNINRKVGGLSLYDANTVVNSVTCIAGIDWWPTTSLQKQVTVWSDSRVYKSDGTDLDAVNLASSGTFTEPVVLVPCGQEYPGNNRKLIVFSKGVAPQFLNANAATLSSMSNVSIDWTSTHQPAAGLVHDNRVAAWGVDSAPHSIYFSALDDHTNFKATDPANADSYPLPIFDIAPGDGEYINACHSLGNTRLYVFKYPAGIYYIDTDSITSIVAPVTTVRKDIGIAGPKAITKVGDLGTWFIGGDGHIYSLDVVNDPNAEPRNACITRSKRLSKWLKDNILPSRLKYAQLVYDTNRGEVWATYTKSSSSNNDLCLVIDVNDPQNFKISTDDRGSYYNALWLSKESSAYQTLLIAGTGGYVYKTDQTSRAIAGVGYAASFRTNDSDFRWADPSYALQNKRYDFLEFRLKAASLSTLYVDIYIDNTYYSTYNVNEGTSGSLLNTGLLDAFTLAGDAYIRKVIKIGGIGRTFSARVYNSGANEDFGVATLIVYFDTLGSGAEV